ncbi:MAG TPA: tetratricopeptide repeat protein [Thermoanaerobaculia bacterium]|nr:tetratricopeptide repeat protein [Thermoanaerobaculia bacterium]
MKGYSSREVAAMLGLSVAQIRSYASSGILQPARGGRGEFRFSFHDLVLLRTAKGLLEANIPLRNVRASLRKLRAQLPDDLPLSAVRISAIGERVIVRDGDAIWSPDSGQVLFDFAVSELAVAPPPEPSSDDRSLTADDWYATGWDLEANDPAAAASAYRQAIELDHRSPDAHVNLGRLLHESGKVHQAVAHYRLALDASPEHAVGLFNLGVALEDLGEHQLAIDAYERALVSDPDLADAHYNLARLYERIGSKAAAIRHLKAYRALSR